MDKFTQIIDVGNAATASIGGGDSSDSSDSLCPSLSFKQRVVGCASMMGVGMLFSILSWVTVFVGDYVFFGVLFTMANLCSIGGTLFLAGPVRQVKSMFNEGRWIASSVYLITMVLTILAAVLVESGILVILCCLVQYGAMWWYFLSYVPFARDAVKGAIASVFNR